MYHREHIRERNKGKKEKKSEKKERGKRKTNTAGGEAVSGFCFVMFCMMSYTSRFFYL